MDEQTLLGPLDDQEYRAIEAALLETPRGRWFLAEHGRRSRRVDSSVLDEVIERLRTSLHEPSALLSVLRSDVERLRGFIAAQRNDLLAQAATTPLQMAGGHASEGAIHHAANMLTAAEDLHALVWSVRDEVPSPDFCEAIARQASRIYAMSHAQAIESERTGQFRMTLDETYQRLSALLETILFEMQSDEKPRGVSFLSNGLR